MRLIYILSCLFLISCVGVKKEYVCGDRPCLDKKDFNEYFLQNLTVEIMPQKDKKIKNNNLIILNTKSENIKKPNQKTSKSEEKLKKKVEKQKLKAEKIRLLEERKIKKAELKLKKKKNKRITKSYKPVDASKKSIIDKKNKKDHQTINVVNKTTVKKSNIKEVKKSDIKINLVRSQNVKSICDSIKDCDIDKIAEILIKEGKEKPFPSITSN